MIPFNFDYYKPNTIEEAVTTWNMLNSQGETPIYITGGTELITLGRLNLLYTNAVIDLKGIPECHVFELKNEELVIGSAVTLSFLEKQTVFPLLASTVKEIADFTSRNKITLGGNICGDIFYREAVLPLLLTDSAALIAGPEGIRKALLKNVFRQELQLEEGEFLIQLIIKKDDLDTPNISIKRRQQWETGYPLITVAALRKKGFIRLAFSGLCPFPFRSETMENAFNHSSIPLKERISTSLKLIPEPILNDVEGSKAYRLFVLQQLLLTVFERLGGENDS